MVPSGTGRRQQQWFIAGSARSLGRVDLNSPLLRIVERPLLPTTLSETDLLLSASFNDCQHMQAAPLT